MRVPKEFIKSLQGKDFVLLGGLLELAHQDGLNYTSTDIIQFPNQENGNTTIVRAVVRTGKGEFSGIGDASPASVPNKSIAVHSIRMAETRAMARALRVATNVSMTAFEELGADIEEKPSYQNYSQPSQHAPKPAAKPQPKPEPKKEVETTKFASEEQRKLIQEKCEAKGLVGDKVHKFLKERPVPINWKKLTDSQANILLIELDNA